MNPDDQHIPKPNVPPPNPYGVPQAEFAGATVSQPMGPGITVALNPEHATDDQVEKQRRNSKLVSVGVAVLIHVLIAVLAILWVVSEFVKETPIIEVTGEGETIQQLEKKQFQQRVTRRPSSSSSNPLPTIVASTQANIAVPEVDEIVDDPMDLGVGGIGEGLGFGSGGAGMGGGAQFIGLKGGGKNIILVIDTSSSMPGNCKPEGIAAIRKEIEKTINALSPRVKFNIVCYANDADLFKANSVPANAKNKKDALAYMEGYFGAGSWNRTRTEQYGEKGTDADGIAYIPMPPGKVEALQGTSGGSRIELGVIIALQMKPSAVFVLSDGEPNTRRRGKRLSHRQIIDTVEDEYQRIFGTKKGSVKVNTISINGEGEKFLRDIARSFGGRHKDIRPDKL